MESYSKNIIDLRGRFFFVISIIICTFFVNNDMLLIISSVVVVLYLLFSGFPMEALQLAICYPIILVLSWTAMQFNFADGFVVILSLMKKMIVPVMAAIPVSKAPTGLLISTLKAAHVPYSLIMSIAVMFRFMPTIHNEYRAIRNAQKFRGIGDSFWTFIKNPIMNIEYIMVPLLIRTARISDELSASAMARGAGDSKTSTTYIEVHFRRKDGFFVIFSTVFTILLLMAERIDWQVLL